MVIYDLAMRIELEGQEHYQFLAENEEDLILKKIFNILADNEKRHFDIINSIIEETPQFIASNHLEAANFLFESEEQFIELEKVKENNISHYNKALEHGKNCIYMYKRLVEEIEDFKLKEIFRALRDEEEKHVTVMENLSQLLIQPKSWFEGANFKLTRRY